MLNALNTLRQRTVHETLKLYYQTKIALFRYLDNRIALLTVMLAYYRLDKTNEFIDREIRIISGTTTATTNIIRSLDSHFDPVFYVNQYDDVRKKRVSPQAHYLLYGWKEDRSPAENISAKLLRELFLDRPRSEFPLWYYQQHHISEASHKRNTTSKIWFEPSAHTMEDWYAIDGARASPLTETVVVMPVYKGRAETLDAIYRVLETRNGSAYSLLVINDAGPDDELNRILFSLSAQEKFDYHINRDNLGFTKTVNRALRELTSATDVILLNSDVFVFNDWYSRIVRHAESDRSIATITPLTNNGTICSYPLTQVNNSHTLETSPSEIDTIAARVNKGLVIEAPTGVGFCMYIRRSAINTIGILDEINFPRGYGEENDFCWRCYLAGLKNVIATDVFVYHTGTISFDSEKKFLLESALTKLTNLYPSFISQIHLHLNLDPEHFVRQNIDIERLINNRKGCIVIMTHKIGGGIETFIKQRRTELENKGESYIVVRFHNNSYAHIDDHELFLPNLKHFNLRTRLLDFFNTLKKLKPIRFEINSFIGISWLIENSLVNFIQSSKIPYVVYCHDYSFISQFTQLLRPDGIYDPNATTEKRVEWQRIYDSNTSESCLDSERVQLYKNFLNCAQKVISPSTSAAKIYQSVFPLKKLEVIPHRRHLVNIAMQEKTNNSKLVIAIVGAIGPHKGDTVIRDLAKFIKDNNLPIELNIIGYAASMEIMLKNNVKISGAYIEEGEAIRKLSELKPDLIFIPSIWPETFCYVLDFALHLGIPPVVFDLGSQAERAKNLKWSTILPLSFSRDPKRLADALLKIDCDTVWNTRTKQLIHQNDQSLALIQK